MFFSAYISADELCRQARCYVFVETHGLCLPWRTLGTNSLTQHSDWSGLYAAKLRAVLLALSMARRVT
jgi:hypothetical protein